MKNRNVLEQIPGVGKAIAQDLNHLGIHQIQDLQNHDPEILYQQLCEYEGKPVDRCMLYVLRCAVYYASTENPDPELLKWWSWKNKSYPQG
jgi:hypothetical protein